MLLIDSASEDTESSEIAATGSIVISVTGTMTKGCVIITGNIGAGESMLWFCTPADTRKMIGLGLKPGITFKAYVKDVASTDSVTVAYIDV